MSQVDSRSLWNAGLATPPLRADRRQPGAPISLRVGILSNGDPDDVRTWSGVPWSMKRELAKRFVEVRAIPSPPGRYEHWLRCINDRLHPLTGRRLVSQWTAAAARRHQRQIHAQLAKTPVDVLLAICVDQQIADPRGFSTPLVHHSDATFRNVCDYYPQYSNLWSAARRAGERTTRRALANAAFSFYPSRWAAESAISDYDAPRDCVSVVPYGANMTEPPTREEALSPRPQEVCRLLWIGGDWERKGGPLTFDTMLELNRRGIPTELTTVGGRPADGRTHPRYVSHGFLNKQVPLEREQYRALWASASFFMLPSVGETFGAVFCEAAAHAVPPIATRTGGVPDAVEHGRGGVLLPTTATAEQAADAIAAVWRDTAAYRRLATGARDRYESVLNWTAWGDAVTPLLVAAARSDTRFSLPVS